jgi:hypothetical protein
LTDLRGSCSLTGGRSSQGRPVPRWTLGGVGLSRSHRNNPPESLLRRAAGHRQPDRSHGRASVRGGRDAPWWRKDNNEPPKPEGGSEAHARAPAHERPRPGRQWAPWPRPAAGGNAGRGPCRRWIARAERPNSAHSGSQATFGPESGDGTNSSALLQRSTLVLHTGRHVGTSRGCLGASLAEAPRPRHPRARPSSSPRPDGAPACPSRTSPRSGYSLGC